MGNGAVAYPRGWLHRLVSALIQAVGATWFKLKSLRNWVCGWSCDGVSVRDLALVLPPYAPLRMPPTLASNLYPCVGQL